MPDDENDDGNAVVDELEARHVGSVASGERVGATCPDAEVGPDRRETLD
jgi:hypothetical protein